MALLDSYSRLVYLFEHMGKTRNPATDESPGHASAGNGFPGHIYSRTQSPPRLLELMDVPIKQHIMTDS